MVLQRPAALLIWFQFVSTRNHMSNKPDTNCVAAFEARQLFAKLTTITELNKSEAFAGGEDFQSNCLFFFFSYHMKSTDMKPGKHERGEP